MFRASVGGGGFRVYRGLGFRGFEFRVLCSRAGGLRLAWGPSS